MKMQLNSVSSFNELVGAMVGLERAILPAIAEKEFNLAAKTAILSFIVVFGFTVQRLNSRSKKIPRSPVK